LAPIIEPTVHTTDVATAADARTSVSPIASPTPLTVRTSRPAGDFSQLNGPEAPVDEAARATKISVPHVSLQKPGSFDEATSQLIERSEFADVYRNEDGTNTSVITFAPSNVKLSDGAWVDGSRAVRKLTDGSFGVARHALSPRFAPTANVPGAFSATRGDFSVSFTLEGADDAAILGAAKRRSSVSEGSVTYPE